MKKKIKIKKIISSLLVLCMIMQLVPQSAIRINASGVTEINLNTTAVNNIYLLTNNQFVTTSEVQTSQGEYRLIDSEVNEASKTVTIGDTTYQEKDYTGTSDINVELKGIKKSLTKLQVNAISNGSKTSNLNVSEASKIGEVKLQENAKAKLTLNADLEISKITMSNGSELKIDTNGHNLKIAGEIASNGNLTLTGTNIDLSGVKVDQLTLDYAEITANNNEISAKEQLMVKNSTVKNASLLGYCEDVTGNKTLTFEGNTNKLNNITAVGTVETGKATITINGENTITASSDINYYCDYNLTYRYNEKELTPKSSWPVSYRVKFQGNMSDSNSTYVGYHNQEGTYTATSEIILPSYAEEGYSYIGWKLDQDTITKLPTGKKVNQTLTAVLKSDKVVVSMDLGYEPGQTTNDDYKNLTKVTTAQKEWGDILNLKTPTRFGYRFAGWKIKSVNDGTTYQNQTSYTVAMSDAKKSSDGEYQIVLEAQWEAKMFPFRFLISGVDQKYIKVHVGNQTYDSIKAFADAYNEVTWDQDNNLLQFANIPYGETLKDYMKSMEISEIPKLVDQRTGEEKLDFSGWSTPGGNISTDDMSFTIGSILDNKADDETLSSYESTITATPVLLTSQWGTASYTLTTDIVDGWEILVNGEVQQPSSLAKLKNVLTGNDTMSIKVQAGSEVTWRCSTSNVQNFSLWNFTEGFLPEETKMISGEKYISYTAKMPYKDVTATKSNAEETYIDISQSPITFDENVQLPSGRSVDGFWYGEKMTASESDGMNINALTPAFQATSNENGHQGEYFYIWNKKDKFHLTSAGKETKNQLSLINEISISLRNCKMTATDSYDQDAVGSQIGGKELGNIFTEETGKNIETDLKNIDLKKYANIVINTVKTNAYTVTLNMEDENSEIMDISTDGFHTANQYKGMIRINGQNTNSATRTKLKIGTIFGDFRVEMNNLEISDYQKTSDNKAFDYAIYTSFSGRIAFTRCTINLKDRDIYTYDYSITIGSSELKARNIRMYYTGFLISGNSKVHIYENVYSMRHTITMSGTSSAVIDGNVVSLNKDTYSSGSIETTGYLIVKGTVFDSANMDFKKGTIICNVLEIGSRTTFSNSARIISNMITGNIHNSLQKTDGKYELCNVSSSKIGNIEKLAENNNDTYPFITYVSSAPTIRNYTFGGDNTKIYLYGYYKTDNQYYDTTVTATSEENPVSQWIGQCLDDQGELENSISLTDDVIQNSVKNYVSSKNNECILIGNSTYTFQTQKPRYVLFNGANIYTAGNVTLLNDTTVSAGTITCNGDFGTKGDLTITGGTIHATTIGNVGSLTTSSADMTKCWKKTKISGGTIDAKTIGARDTYATNDTDQRSNIELTSNPTITDNTKIQSDQYVNYIYDKIDFPDSKNTGLSLNNNIRMNTTWTGEQIGTWTTNKIETFPTLTDDQGSFGSWIYGTITGSTVTGINEDGSFVSDSDKKEYVQDSDRVLFYGVKQKYSLTKVYGNKYYDLTVDGKSATDSFENTTMTDISDMTTSDVLQANVKQDAQITLKVTDAKYKKRTVVWYKDGNGQYHNALNGAEWEDNSITFSMPRGNCYIYVVDDDHQLPLDLKSSGLTFTNDGFITEFADTDSDGNLSAKSSENVFQYSGDYKIVQSNIKNGDISKETYNHTLTINDDSKKTTNRIRFSKDFNNLDSTDFQNIFINRVYQQCEDSQFGVVLEDGAKVKMQVEGMNTLFRFSVKENSKLDLSGKTGNEEDTLYFMKSTTNIPSYYNVIIGNVNNDGGIGKTGECIIEKLDIRMLAAYAGYLMNGGGSENNRNGSLKIKDCKLIRRVWGDSSYIGYNLANVTINNSTIELPNGTSYTTPFFTDCENVTIENKSEVAWHNIGSTTTGGYPIDYRIGNQLIVDDSTIDITYDARYMSNGNMNVNEPTARKAKKVVLKNHAEFNIDSRAIFNNLEVNDDAKLTVRQTQKGEDTYLLCPNITVNGGNIDTDYLVVSGYYDAKTESTNSYATSKAVLDDRIKDKSYIMDGDKNTGLSLKSGTVNANKFVGGDVNGKINVQGGTLNSPKIGTSGKLFGFTRLLPANETDYVYQYPILDYSAYTQSATVTVSGGTVNVAENGYLGGMNSNVNVQGGNIVLADKAVFGMNDEQTATLKNHYSTNGDDIKSHTDTNCNVNISGGSISQGENASGNINTPYGKITISGQDTKIKIAKVSADYATIEMSQANNGYENPYQGGETGATYKKDKVGIWITDTLSAQTIKITNGAQVYAKNAYAEIIDDKGVLQVQEAALYSTSYGEKGISRKNEEKQYNDTPGATEQTVFGTKMVSVTYDINPNGEILDSDLSEITNDNQKNYTVTNTTTTIDLKNLICDGYEFKGWYTNKECTGNPVTSLDTSIANDLTLYAKWQKVKVKFKIVMDKDSSSEFKDSEFEGDSNWQKEGSDYVYAKQPEITYGDKILSVAGVNLKDYSTNTLGVTELEILEADYQGSKAINAETIVTKQLAKYYKDNNDKTIVLHVSRVQKRYATITFSLNQKDGKPADARFTQTSLGIAQSMELQDNIGVDKALGSVDKFADASVTEGKSKGLIQPTATGYTFIGWNTDQNATQMTTDGWVNKDNIFKSSTTLYAIWQANTYKIEFNAGNDSWVTTRNNEPAVNSDKNTRLYFYWMYDTPISEDNSFWIKEENTNAYMTELPYAWKEGYTFDNANGWNYSYEQNGQTYSGQIDSTKVLSGIFIQALDVSKGNPDGNPEQTALTLTASFTPVKVTYDLNGGTWKGSSKEDETEPAYGDALYGYTKGEATNEEEVVSTVIGENQEKYQICSTTKTEFSNKKTYIADDYRNQLSRKGYTFKGWMDENEKEVGTTPRFRNVTLKAKWTANSYSLTLNSLTTNDSSYSKFHTAADKIENISVKIGEEIDAANWPSRNGEWYAYDKDLLETNITDDQKRYLLGFTFEKLDPGTTRQSDSDGYRVYQNYAKTITNLQNNSNTLYQSKVRTTNHTASGTIFKLPEDGMYANDIGGTTSYEVPDYPDGCTINMYAVYRERSLVFVERYIDPDGNIQQNIKYSTAWNQWSDYPTNSYGTNGNSQITDQGYSLIGWYVNGTTNAAAAYPKDADDYDSKKDKFKQTAEDIGTYDIMVYTIYVAQVTRSDITLTAKKDPTNEELSTNSYTLPSSMQSGNLKLSISSTNGNLKIVSKDTMQAHQYDQTWTEDGTTYSSDDTIAIIARISKGNITKEKDLSEVIQGNGDFSQQVEAGWQLTFTLYHSKVMTKESDYEVDVKANFSSTDQGSNLENQWILNKIQVRLQPSEYRVRYQIHLPEETGNLIMNQEGSDFEKPSDKTSKVITKEVTLGYGSSLSNKLPMIEGYTVNNGWQYADSDQKYQTLNMKVNSQNQGVINLTRDYTVNTYDLAADNQTLADWKITYSNGASDSSSSELSMNEKVKYHSKITLTPKNLQAGKVPEFITLTLGYGEEKKVKLSEYATKDGDAYTFTMPAMAVAASYVTEETMYLEEGTISITESGYTQTKSSGTVTKTWPGNYVILQNKDNNAQNLTNNRLILSGDLSSKIIQIGNLNINANDSIELKDSANAKIVMGDQTSISALTAKNIKVPQTAEFSCTPPQNSNDQVAIMALNPDKNFAAIGDVKGNGKITLDHLKILAVMPSDSKASVIGSETEAQQLGKDIVLTGSEMNVEEQSDTSTYKGTWIGGKSVSKVTLDHVDVKRSTDTYMSGPLITNADDVDIKNCTIGTQQYMITDPIYAKNKLSISSSNIYQNILNDITGNAVGKTPIGTDDGITEITNSTINTTRSGGISKISDLYSGSLFIKDKESDVTIDGNQIIDLSNGSVDIKTTAYDQGGLAHTAKAARNNYVLLEEGNVTQAVPDLTLTSLADNATIEVRKPSGKNENQTSTVKAGKLNVADNLNKLLLKGNLEFTGTAQFTKTSGITVNVRSSETENTLKVDGDAFTENAGTYTQTGGKLQSDSNIGSGKLDVVLTDVNVNANNLYAKDLTVKSSSITANESAGSKPDTSDVTKVSVKSSSITAKEIGALGTYDQTFTIVNVDDTSTLTGNVIKDEYRIAYDNSGASLDTSTLSKVLRTSELGDQVSIQPENGIPAQPVDTNNLFSGWYIKEQDADQVQRKALKSGTTTLPGLKQNTTLDASTINKVVSDDVATNSDGTKTLKVHAWLNATGEVVIEKGRKFEKTSAKTKTITAQTNGAWTAQLTSNATFIDGRDYQVIFDQALPQGTKLTLTIPKTSNRAGKYYYYDVTNDTTTSVKFSEFKKMGTDQTFKSETYAADVIPENEVYLLSADFAQAKQNAVQNKTVSFELIPEEGSTSNLPMGNVTYDLTAVTKGNISVTDNTVTITKLPKDDDNLKNQQLYIKAKFQKNNSTNDEVRIPFNVEATLGSIKGKWINRNTAVFKLGSYESVQSLSELYEFRGLTLSDYKITWTMVYGDGNSDNIIGNVVSNNVVNQ